MKSTKLNLKFGSFSINLLANLLLFAVIASPIAGQTKTKPTPIAQTGPQIPVGQKVINVFANQGPTGEMYLPKELAASSDVFKLVANQTSKKYFFPSIYFIVSAKPNLQEEFQGKRGSLYDYEYKNLSQNLEWLKIEINAVVKKCPTTPDGEGEIVTGENAIRILGLLPDESIARTEDSSIAQGVAKGGELANAIVPFFPGASSIVETGTNVANVLFSNILYPPRLVTYRYSYIDNQRTFGWYWRADKTNNTSLLGLRRGVILLQAERANVGSIELSYNIYAKWNKDVDKNIDDEYVDKENSMGKITLQTKCEDLSDKNFFQTQNYRFLKNLDGFPMLIPEDAVCDIFQVSNAEACNSEQIKAKRTENCNKLKKDEEQKKCEQVETQKCQYERCKPWIDVLLEKNKKEITFFEVPRPIKVLIDNKVIETNEALNIRLLRRPDLETVLVDKKKDEIKEYRINVQQ